MEELMHQGGSVQENTIFLGILDVLLVCGPVSDENVFYFGVIYS